LAVDVLQLRDFYAFDDEVTAPLNGFSGADEYYATCSSRRFLLGITAPTLIIHALDDPFVFRETVPEEAELGPGVLLELSPHGGHVGFVHGTSPRRARYWTDERIPAFLQDRLKRRG
jgi:hypothetical protein